jgi:hypothetical protein
MAALETPLPAAWTSTVCPGRTRALSTTICHAVRKTSGTAATSVKGRSPGYGSMLASGTTTCRE